jgi:hypothetical protein
MRVENTDYVRTDDGFHLIRYAQVGEAHVTRRDDLRGCWEFNGTIYSTRQEAFDAAERVMSQDLEGPPETTLPVAVPPSTMIG